MVTTTLDSSVTGLRTPRGSALAALASRMFLIVLDVAMVNLAAPTIRDSVGLTSAGVPDRRLRRRRAH